MSKRFPIPAFDRDLYKNLAWQPPRLLSRAEREKLIAAARAGDAGAYGCHPVEAGDAFFERFSLRGDHRHAVMCVLPNGPVRMVGRSWAWPLQRAVVVDSLDPASARVLQDWKTPRPMNTRLGPDEGVTLEAGGVVYALFGHRYDDHWIANRTLTDARAEDAGFSVLSAADEANDDFHACNLSFRWS